MVGVSVVVTSWLSDRVKEGYACNGMRAVRTNMFVLWWCFYCLVSEHYSSSTCITSTTTTTLLCGPYFGLSLVRTDR